MRRILVIIGILFLGLIYAHVDQSEKSPISNMNEESLIRNTPDEQESVIREHLFVNSECEITAQSGGSSVSRVPTRTLQHNVFQRLVQLYTQKNAETNIKVFQFRSTAFLKRQPLSKNYFIYYLKRIIC